MYALNVLKRLNGLLRLLKSILNRRPMLSLLFIIEQGKQLYQIILNTLHSHLSTRYNFTKLIDLTECPYLIVCATKLMNLYRYLWTSLSFSGMHLLLIGTSFHFDILYGLRWMSFSSQLHNLPCVQLCSPFRSLQSLQP